MRRNCCDAYGYLHRKWAYFASQIAMRYQLFLSLHTVSSKVAIDDLPTMAVSGLLDTKMLLKGK